MDKFINPKTKEELFKITDDNEEVLTEKGKKYFKDLKEKKDNGPSDNNGREHSEEG